MTTGQILKSELGLEIFDTVWIRKIIDIPLSIYLVYFNSRQPTTYLSINKIKNLDTFTLKKLKQSGVEHKFNNYKYTPAILLDDFNAKVMTDSMLIRIDIAGEMFANTNLYDNVNKEYFDKNKILLG